MHPSTSYPRFSNDYGVDGDDGDRAARNCESHERCCPLSPPLSPLPDDDNDDDGGGSIPLCGMRNYDPAPNNAADRSAERLASKSGAMRASQFGEFPWTVALLLLQRMPPQSPRARFTPPEPSATVATPRFDFLCGGSLIHPHIVLSAAHCVAAAPDHRLHVRAGEWDTRHTGERWPHQDRTVRRTVVHPDYEPATVRNDIALLFLHDAVRLAAWSLTRTPTPTHIGTVCLPPAGRTFAAGSACWVSGWGKDGFGRGGRFQAVMKRVRVPLVGRTTCERALRATKLGPYFRLDASFVCAGGVEGRDACKGDGGSPLVCEQQRANEDAADDGSLVMEPAAMLRGGDENSDGVGEDDNGRGGDGDLMAVTAETGATTMSSMTLLRTQRPFYQAGIVAWGVGCNERVPAAYVNVARFRRWIDGEVTLRGWDPAFYTAEADAKNEL